MNRYLAPAVCAAGAVAAYGLGAGHEWILAFALLACAGSAVYASRMPSRD